MDDGDAMMMSGPEPGERMDRGSRGPPKRDYSGGGGYSSGGYRGSRGAPRGTYRGSSYRGRGGPPLRGGGRGRDMGDRDFGSRDFSSRGSSRGMRSSRGRDGPSPRGGRGRDMDGMRSSYGPPMRRGMSPSQRERGPGGAPSGYSREYDSRDGGRDYSNSRPVREYRPHPARGSPTHRDFGPPRDRSSDFGRDYTRVSYKMSPDRRGYSNGVSSDYGGRPSRDYGPPSRDYGPPSGGRDYAPSGRDYATREYSAPDTGRDYMDRGRESRYEGGPRDYDAPPMSRGYEGGRSSGYDSYSSGGPPSRDYEGRRPSMTSPRGPPRMEGGPRGPPRDDRDRGMRRSSVDDMGPPMKRMREGPPSRGPPRDGPPRGPPRDGPPRGRGGRGGPPRRFVPRD